MLSDQFIMVDVTAVLVGAFKYSKNVQAYRSIIFHPYQYRSEIDEKYVIDWWFKWCVVPSLAGMMCADDTQLTDEQSRLG